MDRWLQMARYSSFKSYIFRTFRGKERTANILVASIKHIF